MKTISQPALLSLSPPMNRNEGKSNAQNTCDVLACLACNFPEIRRCMQLRCAHLWVDRRHDEGAQQAIHTTL